MDNTVSQSPNFGMSSIYSTPKGPNTSSKREILSEKRNDFASGEITIFVKNSLDIVQNERHITGKLELNLRNVSFVRGIWVRLSGKTEILSQSKSTFGNPIKSKELLEHEEYFHIDGIYRIFMGFGKHDNDHDQLIELQPGFYSWPFSFTLSNNCPLTYCDQYTKTIYKLTGQFESPEIKESQSNVVHYVNVSHFNDEHVAKSFLPDKILGKEKVFGIKEASVLTNLFSSLSCIPRTEEVVASLESQEEASFPFEFLNVLYPATVRIEPPNSKDPVKLVIHLALVVEIMTRSNSTIPFPMQSTSDCKRKAFRIWERKMPIQLGAYEETVLNFDVPISINPFVKRGLLEDWPEPLALPHHEYSSILNWSETGEFHRYRVYVRALVTNPKETRQYCSPLIGEICIRPPCQQLREDSPFVVRSGKKAFGVQYTPQAMMARPKVTGEAVSYGPAAVVFDRRADNINVSPWRFSTMREFHLVDTEVMCSPQFSPTTAYVWSASPQQFRAINERDTPSTVSSDEHSTRSNPAVASPPAHTSPVEERTRLNFSNERLPAILNVNDTNPISQPTRPSNIDDFSTEVLYAEHTSGYWEYQNPAFSTSRNQSRLSLLRLTAACLAQKVYTVEDILMKLSEEDSAISYNYNSDYQVLPERNVTVVGNRGSIVVDQNGVTTQKWINKVSFIREAIVAGKFPKLTAKQWVDIHHLLTDVPTEELLTIIRATFGYVDNREELLPMLSDDDTLLQSPDIIAAIQRS